MKTVKEARIENAVVFVENSNGYESVFPENHPYLESDIIYALDLGAEKNKELMKKFPDRKFYILDSNSIRTITPQ